MKGLQGLIIAVGLGVIGALCNFAYLAIKSQDVVRVAFLGVKPDVEIPRGEFFREEHFTRVEIPASAVGNLDQFVYKYEDMKSVVGVSAAWRTIPRGSLLLRQDTKTPDAELTFGRDAKDGVSERAMWVPIDLRKVVPSLLNPGDYVSFITSGGIGPTLADEEMTKVEPGKPVPAAPPRRPPTSSGEPQVIGPFRVLSIGNRLTSAEVARTAKAQSGNEGVLTILVRLENNKFDAEAARLIRLLDETNSRPLAYLLHPRSTQGK